MCEEKDTEARRTYSRTNTHEHARTHADKQRSWSVVVRALPDVKTTGRRRTSSLAENRKVSAELRPVPAREMESTFSLKVHTNIARTRKQGKKNRTRNRKQKKKRHITQKQKQKTYAPSSSSPSSRLHEQYVAGFSCSGQAKNTVGSRSSPSVAPDEPATDLIAYPSSCIFVGGG